jgi:hypothetical protein
MISRDALVVGSVLEIQRLLVRSVFNWLVMGLEGREVGVERRRTRILVTVLLEVSDHICEELGDFHVSRAEDSKGTVQVSSSA